VKIRSYKPRLAVAYIIASFGDTKLILSLLLLQ